MHALAEFSDRCHGDTIIVCGCGASLSSLPLPLPDQVVTIGVNDVGRLFDPDYLVVVNPRSQFKGDRFRYVENSRANFLVTQLDLGIAHPNIVLFKLGKRGGTDFSDPHVLHYTNNSPYVALCLAVHMGARRIGLIGVDFTENHFFAATGRHVLANFLDRINREYAFLEAACGRMGIEMVNLSTESRLTALPKVSIETFLNRAKNGNMVTALSTPMEPRVFFVDYQFLSCGDVFSEGLRHAAANEAVACSGASWDDPTLPEKVARFRPDFMFVLHGRRFAQHWKNEQFGGVPSAVWLLDEPYEVDDTQRWSGRFDRVFVCDPSTIARHRQAYYLPVGYDPLVHRDEGGKRDLAVGFIGGGNPTRERMLAELAGEKLLSYVVGGPWRQNDLKALCRSGNLPPRETASLYQRTRIVVNVFRDRHHFNREGIPARSMNPRIYEALACGALVVTERRPEVEEVFSDLPVFKTPEELVSIVRTLLEDPDDLEKRRRNCLRRLGEHSYAKRLREVLRIIVGKVSPATAKVDLKERFRSSSVRAGVEDLPPGWVQAGGIARSKDGVLSLSKTADQRPGAEEGIASCEPFDSVDLRFEVKLAPGTQFIAKVLQASQQDQKTNSYHVVVGPDGGYLAKHRRVLSRLDVSNRGWQKLRIIRRKTGLVEVWINGVAGTAIKDLQLQKGYCFLGIKGGSAELRGISVASLAPLCKEERFRADTGAERVRCTMLPPYDVVYDDRRVERPSVSIVTTVFDRIDCLRKCLRSVRELQFDSYEHIVVCDRPGDRVSAAISEVIEASGTGGNLAYARLHRRFNNWGIAPAWAGVNLSRGRYVCFLSDDNGYHSSHFGPLFERLELEPNLGFAYSACIYRGQKMLRCSPPRPGSIDLGQPLFRKELFDRHLGGGLPFHTMAWDWELIYAVMKAGERWVFVDRPTFLFDLGRCLGSPLFRRYFPQMNRHTVEATACA